jgi:hypothetical protein
LEHTVSLDDVQEIFLNVIPFSQGLHVEQLEEPVTELKKPAAHVVQTVVPVEELYDPGLHGMVELNIGQNDPAGHITHVDIPVLLYVPAMLHDVQTDIPVVPL